MLNEIWTDWLRLVGGHPCFQIFGKARPESEWRIIDIYATSRRNLGSRWPLWDGTCITWSAQIISVGWDFAATVLSEQIRNPASREHPVEVSGGRIRDAFGRKIPKGNSPNSEVLAHECGHTWQALRLRDVYLPFVGLVTWFREGPHAWSYFENQASNLGQCGGIVKGSVCPEIMSAAAPSSIQ
jgi:hypothetical protein